HIGGATSQRSVRWAAQNNVGEGQGRCVRIGTYERDTGRSLEGRRHALAVGGRGDRRGAHGDGNCRYVAVGETVVALEGEAVRAGISVIRGIGQIRGAAAQRAVGGAAENDKAQGQGRGIGV